MFNSLLTLTYGQLYPADGAVVKDHLNTFLTWFRREYNPVDYLWFLEFQSRGAPHIHILLSTVPSPFDRQNVAETWAFGVAMKWPPFKDIGPKAYMGDMCLKMVNVHKHEKAWSDLKTPDGASRYITKYASKPEQKEVPKAFQNVGRFWGASRKVKPKAVVTDVDMDEGELRLWLKQKGRDLGDYDVLPKYIWLFDENGVK